MATERPQRARAGLKPNAELRKALDEADKSMSLFNDGKFIDYFQSLNEVYLNSKGKLHGPETVIGAGLNDDMELENQTLLELGRAGGSVAVSLEWEDPEEDSKNIRKNISMTLNYHSSTDCFSMFLFASTQTKFGEVSGSGLLDTGTSIQRNFLLNPEPVLPKHIDDLLLTFTNELFDSGIL